jgi:hypothetical protein
MLLPVQGPSSASQFWAEWAKPVAEYLDGFAEAAQALDLQQSLLMDSSLSTSHFYWSAGASPCRPRCLALASCLLSHAEGVEWTSCVNTIAVAINLPFEHTFAHASSAADT